MNFPNLDQAPFSFSFQVHFLLNYLQTTLLCLEVHHYVQDLVPILSNNNNCRPSTSVFSKHKLEYF